MPKYPGRIISATPPTVSLSGASGVWTLEEALQYQQAGTWPVAVGPVVADPNFNQTVLLLHGDGTNGAQNNTFLDGSTNNFTITRNGNTTQGTFSPFSVGAGEWSNYFDGNGDYLTFNSSTVCNFGTGDFTISFWVYLTTALSAAINVFDARASASTVPFIIGIDADEKPYFYDGTSSLTASDAISVNAWNHLSFVRSSGTLNIYINAVSKLSTAMTVNISSTGTAARIGANLSNSAYFPGYISNFLIEKGTASPPSSVPTSPYVVDANTDFLSCQSNRFVDNSTNAFAITRNGDVRVTPFSPFAPAAAYDPAVNGGSGYFDGSGDYLTAPNNSVFDFGSGNFTLETFYYPTSSTPNGGLINKRANNGSYAPFNLGFGGSLTPTFLASFNGTTWGINTSFTIPATLNAWNHIAVTRNGSTFAFWMNGQSAGTATNSSTLTTNTSAVSIGATSADGTAPIPGYFSNTRIIKGTAVYTSNFTPPTAPLTAITNTSLLLNFTNAGIFDNTGKNNLETVGNAQIDTTTKKYGTGSMEFDGTGDRLVIPYSPYLLLESGDFTVEMWLYKNANTAYMTACGNLSSPNTNSWQILSDVNGTKIGWFSNNAFQLTGTTTLNASTWYHVAFVRSGSSFKLYVNGTEDASTTNSVNFNVTNSLFVGHTPELTAGRDWNGYIDDLRITKGVPRYTANFTPPTQAFSDF